MSFSKFWNLKNNNNNNTSNNDNNNLGKSDYGYFYLTHSTTLGSYGVQTVITIS